MNSPPSIIGRLEIVILPTPVFAVFCHYRSLGGLESMSCDERLTSV